MPTIALGNLWHILLATATAPGAPSDIIAGVSTKAPPEPMKPLSRPPTRPTISRAINLSLVRPRNMTVISVTVSEPLLSLNDTLAVSSSLTSSAFIDSSSLTVVGSLVSEGTNVAVWEASFTWVNDPILKLSGGALSAKAAGANTIDINTAVK